MRSRVQTSCVHARAFEIRDFIGQILSRDAIALGPESSKEQAT